MSDKYRPIYNIKATEPIEISRLTPNPNEGDVIGHVNGVWGRTKPFVYNTSTFLVGFNRVYGDGVLIIETDTGRAKLADGVDDYVTLPYIFNVTGGGLNGLALTYSTLPPAITTPNQYWGVLNSEGTSWLPGWLGGTYYSRGIYYSDGVDWHFLGSAPYQATQAEVDAGIIEDKFVSPKTLKDASYWTTHTHNMSDLIVDLPYYDHDEHAISDGLIPGMLYQTTGFGDIGMPRGSVRIIQPI